MINLMSLLKESISTTAWFTSFSEVSQFKDQPTWFTTELEYAQAYHNNSDYEGKSVHTYQVQVSGNILTQAEAKKLATKIGVDWEQTVTELTSNPTTQERQQLVQPFVSYCDGFFHWDYDPRDWGDGESMLVFSPNKTVTIVKEMNFTAQSNRVAEAVVNGKVICDNCKWSWAVKDGTQDGETNPYLCHKCDYDNRPVKPKKK